MVGITHGQQSIHRAILVPADGVDNRMPRETLVARVREQGGEKSQETTLSPKIGRLQDSCIKTRKDGV